VRPWKAGGTEGSGGSLAPASVLPLLRPQLKKAIANEVGRNRPEG
jgi:hypothetical protein